MTELGAPGTYYETYWSPGGFSPGSNLSPMLRQLFEAHVAPGAACLDVGCGDGQTAGVWFRDHGRSYIGVDVSANAVASARAIGLEAHVIEAAASLPFGDAEFDAVVCIEVLEHLFAPAAAVAEMLRVLKPRGVLLATVPNVAYWRRRLELAVLGRFDPFGDGLSVEQPWRDPHIRFFSVGTLRRMLDMAGFEDVWISGHEGTLVGDLPWLRRFRRSRESSSSYRFLEQRLPALLGMRLHAIAYKPRPQN
jgi:methionine biosynthesis protein MetW